MAKKLISFNFNGEFCEELSDLTQAFPITTEAAKTKYCTTSASRISEYVTDTYVAELIANYLQQIKTLHLFVARTTDGRFVAEYGKNMDAVQICIMEKSDTVTFQAGILSGTGMLSQFDGGHKGSVFISSLLPTIFTDHEALNYKNLLETYDKEDIEYSMAMCGLCNNIYYRIKDEKSTDPIAYSQEVKRISQADIDAVQIAEVYCGDPQVFSRDIVKVPESVKKSKPKETESLRNLYLLNKERKLTEEEEKRVPDLGEWYCVPEWAKKTASRIQKSRRFRNTISNILLYGPSGTGKTEGSQAIAEMLGLPYYSYGSSVDDDKIDLLGNLIPNTNKKSVVKETPDEICERLGIPTYDDAENDFEASFEKLFGKTPGKFDTAADCFKEISKKILEESKKADDNDFVFVESELIQAIKTGGFCEIQEANIIKNSAVMEALNPLLANNGDTSFVKLQTGEIIRRHPDCIIAFTVNRDYEGCNDLQEAVYSRINLIKQIPEPSVEEMIARTKSQTGFTSASWLKKMALTVYEIHNYCKDKDITSGVSGPRELIDWAQATMLESEDQEETSISEDSVITAAFETILEKAAQNEDDIEDIIVGVFKKQFSASKVDAIRKTL